MPSFFHIFRVKSCAFLLVAFVLGLVLTACNSGTITKHAPAHTANTLVVGEQEGTEAQLLSGMYVLMLQHAGFKVVERAMPVSNSDIFKALSDGQIDLYPAFTSPGLSALGLNSTGNAQQDYLQIKQGYEGKYHLTWLNLAPLDDTYGLCITQDESSKLNGLKISDQVKELSQLSLATSTDIAKNVVPQLQATYGLSFKAITTYPQENAALAALGAGTQKLAMCHTTNPLIISDKLALLQDDKNAFASNNPAPIVRDSLLRQMPQVMTVLNKLAPYLTTEVSQQLQVQVIVGKQSVNTVATRFLQSKGLL